MQALLQFMEIRKLFFELESGLNIEFFRLDINTPEIDKERKKLVKIQNNLQRLANMELFKKDQERGAI